MGKSSPPEIDLHGMTLVDAFAEADRELNHLFIQDITDRRIRFITGWGDVLRPMVQEYLKEHPLVKELRVEGPVIQIVLEDL